MRVEAGGLDVMEAIDPRDYTEAEKAAVAFVKRVGKELVGFTFAVEIYPKAPAGMRWSASWERGVLEKFSFYRSGMKGDWTNADRIKHLVIHECAHHFEGDHLSSDYHDALVDLGVAMTNLALTKRHLFKGFI